jgi:hypothetical protein
MQSIVSVNLKDIPNFNRESMSCRGFVRVNLIKENLLCDPNEWPEQQLDLSLGIGDDENYTLKRTFIDKNGFEKTETYPLADAKVMHISPQMFEFRPREGDEFQAWVTADNIESQWVHTLKTVAKTATQREQELQARKEAKKNQLDATRPTFEQSHHDRTESSSDGSTEVSPLPIVQIETSHDHDNVPHNGVNGNGNGSGNRNHVHFSDQVDHIAVSPDTSTDQEEEEASIDRQILFAYAGNEGSPEPPSDEAHSTARDVEEERHHEMEQPYASAKVWSRQGEFTQQQPLPSIHESVKLVCAVVPQLMSNLVLPLLSIAVALFPTVMELYLVVLLHLPVLLLSHLIEMGVECREVLQPVTEVVHAKMSDFGEEVAAEWAVVCQSCREACAEEQVQQAQQQQPQDSPPSGDGHGDNIVSPLFSDKDEEIEQALNPHEVFAEAEHTAAGLWGRVSEKMHRGVEALRDALPLTAKVSEPLEE